MVEKSCTCTANSSNDQRRASAPLAVLALLLLLALVASLTPRRRMAGWPPAPPLTSLTSFPLTEGGFDGVIPGGYDLNWSGDKLHDGNPGTTGCAAGPVANAWYSIRLSQELTRLTHIAVYNHGSHSARILHCIRARFSLRRVHCV
jgi:hypothetical protein